MPWLGFQGSALALGEYVQGRLEASGGTSLQPSHQQERGVTESEVEGVGRPERGGRDG